MAKILRRCADCAHYRQQMHGGKWKCEKAGFRFRDSFSPDTIADICPLDDVPDVPRWIAVSSGELPMPGEEVLRLHKAFNELLIDMAARVAKWQDDSGAWHDVVFAANAAEIRALLEHIEAQEEALQEYRETLASQYAAIVEDNDLHQQLEQAQAAAAAMRQELDRLDTRFFWCPECGRETPEVHVDDCALARSLSGTAGQALLDELERLRVEAARLQRLIDEHDARVMQPGGVPYEYPVQLAAEAAGMMVALTTIDGAIKRGEHHGSVWQLIVDIENAIEPTRKTTVGQAVLDELTGLRAVAKAAVVFEQAVNRGWNYSVTGSDMCDAGGELLLCLAACGYGDALLVERVQAGEAAGYLREEKSNARTTE